MRCCSLVMSEINLGESFICLISCSHVYYVVIPEALAASSNSGPSWRICVSLSIKFKKLPY